MSGVGIVIPARFPLIPRSLADRTIHHKTAQNRLGRRRAAPDGGQSLPIILLAPKPPLSMIAKQRKSRSE
ncbi:hypothetical protein H8B02_11475 [Bradyrhizobium sp. Pear77]|uniref:hypothetical protein n=1 Tax=Bradyrhizobium altum TaxID=1571202 RepID=UPI001E62662B|nr:hypothetical protein [Bradyrhizobium altum]MCC8954057.1 hypothetical protein [Bradyrhizobium altum]